MNLESKHLAGAEMRASDLVPINADHPDYSEQIQPEITDGPVGGSITEAIMTTEIEAKAVHDLGVHARANLDTLVTTALEQMKEAGGPMSFGLRPKAEFVALSIIDQLCGPEQLDQPEEGEINGNSN
jgi:hypothetical protein